MQPFLLLGSLQPIANFLGVAGLVVGGLLVYLAAGLRKANVSNSSFSNFLALMMSVAAVVIFIGVAFLLFGDWS
ncbi:hypothetical protein ACVWYF_002137 [Hymenobacter sp. UYAg731]